MGCGTSRMPVRVGIILDEEDDFGTRGYERMPSQLGGWVDENEEDAHIRMQSSSPPPYTPVPLKGHFSLMHGTVSPIKRENSLDSSFHESELEVSVTNCSLGEPSLHVPDAGDGNDVIRAGASPPYDLNSSYTSAEVTGILNSSLCGRSLSFSEGAGPSNIRGGAGGELEMNVNTHSSSHPALFMLPTSSTSHPSPSTTTTLVTETADMTQTTGDPESSPALHHIVCPLSSLPLLDTDPLLQLPSERPPSPFPLPPSNASPPPPLALIRPLGSHRVMHTNQDLSAYERMPFRLPPLQQQRQDNQRKREGQSSHDRKHRRKRRHTWQGQSRTDSQLPPIAEHLTVVQ